MHSGLLFPAVGALVPVLLALPAAAEPDRVQHPVFPVEQVAPAQAENLRKAVAPYMAFSPAKIAEFIVPRTTFFQIACPNCTGGNVSTHYWNWSPDDPDHIKCKYGGMLFPNDRYPLDKETVITDSTGTVQHYRYWEGKHGYKK